MGNYYTMNNDGSISPADITTWARWYETADLKIAVDELGGATVYTLFLGINHQFGDGPPLLFETLVLGGPLDQEIMRYQTIEEARAGHAEMVERVRDEINKADQEITRAIKWIKEEAPHPGSTAHLLAEYAAHVTAEKDKEIERMRAEVRVARLGALEDAAMIAQKYLDYLPNYDPNGENDLADKVEEGYGNAIVNITKAIRNRAALDEITGVIERVQFEIGRVAKLEKLARNFEIQGPDAEGLVWLVLHGHGSSTKGMFNLGYSDQLATRVALALEEERRAAIKGGESLDVET